MSSFSFLPAPPVTSDALPRLIVFDVLMSMEGIRICNGAWEVTAEFDTVIKFAPDRIIDGDATWVRVNAPVVVMVPVPVFVNNEERDPDTATIMRYEYYVKPMWLSLILLKGLPSLARCRLKLIIALLFRLMTILGLAWCTKLPVPPDVVEIGVLAVNVPADIVPALSSPAVRVDLFTTVFETDKTILLLKAVAKKRGIAFIHVNPSKL